MPAADGQQSTGANVPAFDPAYLEKELAALRGENDSLKSQLENIADTASSNTAAMMQSATEMQEQMKQVVAENGALRRELDELKKVVKIGAEKPTEEPQKPVVPAEPFEVEGKQYVFTRARFTIPPNKVTGRVTAITVTATDAMSDQRILAELVALGSGVIKELV